MDDLHGGSVTLDASPSAGRTGPPDTRLVRAVHADEAPLMHLALRTMLAAMHGFVLTAAAGTVAEAQQLVLRAQPDLLISDAELAGQSGIDLCRWTRQASPRTVPVILTSRDEPRLALSALAAGASGYL